jgi:hypothetical protein
MKSLSSKTYQCGVTIEGLTTLAGITYLTGITNTPSWDHVIVGTTAQGQIYTRTYAQFMTDVATGIGLSGYVPTSRTLSINGTTYDLSANRSWTISTVDYTSRLQHQVKAGVAINKGQAVYVTSADGTNMIVGLASNASEATSSKTMGLLDATVTTNGFANVVTEGLLAGLDTSTAGSEGDPVWLGTGGNLIYGLANKPYAPAHLVFIGIVTRKNNSNGEIFVKVQNGFELNEIHDVDLKTTVPVNGHILGFDGTLWVNKTIAGWLGYTPANASGTTNYLSKFTGSTTLGNSLVYDNGTNVGIGTTTPSYKLEVNGGPINIINGYSEPTAEAGYRLKFADNGGINNDSGIGLSGSLGSESLWINKGSANGNIRFMFGTLGEKVTFTSAGNVGIGTTNPLFTLDVNGTTKLRTATYFGQISQPSAPTLGTNSPTGGTLPADTYTYRISALDFWNAETTPSNSLVVTTTGSTSSVSMSWPLVQGAYNYRIYRTNSGGTTVYYTNSGTNSTSFTDTGAAGTVGGTASVNSTAYGFFNTNGTFRSGNIVIANNGVGNTSSITFDKSTDGPSINVVEYANDATMYEFALRDNPDGGSDFFHWVMPDWQNSSSGWKPLKFFNFVTQIVGQSSNFWSSFSLPSSTPYYTTNPESLSTASIKWDPYTSTSYNLPKDNGTGTGVFNVDITGFTGTNNTIYWVIIQAGATTFNWGTGWSGNAPVGTGVAITGGWQTLGDGVQVRIIGSVAASDRWAFRAFPVPKMGIGTTTPVAPLQISSTVRPTSTLAQGVYANPTLVATANNDVLVGVDVNASYTLGAYTGVVQMASRFAGRVHINNSYLSIGANATSADTNYGNGYITSFNQVFGLQGSSGTRYMQMFHTTGNFVFQNGGTFTDAGYRLDVNGTGRFQGNLDVVGIGTQASPSTLNIYGVNATTAGDAKLVLSQISGGNDLMMLVAGTDTRSDGLTSNDQYVMAGQRLNLMSRGNGSTYNTRIIIGDGSTSAYANIKFQTATQNSAPADRMLIDHLGNIGIGTTSPTSRLHVWNGGIKITGFPSSSNPFNFLESNYNDTAVAVRFQNINPSNGLDADLGIQLTNNSGSFTDVLRIKGSTGRVGIGTTSPSTLLDVNGVITATGGNSTNWNTAFSWGNHSSAGYVPQTRTLTINGTTYDLSANRSWTIATTTPGGSNTQFQYNSSGTLAGASALTYDSGTNRVGINQASPGYDLDVNGQLRVQDKLRVGNVNSGNGVVHMSSTATINPSATTIVWSQNVSVGMCAFIEYYILNNNTTTDQRAGTIMVTWNQSGTPTIAHTETTTPDIGSTIAVNFTSSLVGSDARINAVNSSAAPYTIVMNYRYF